MKAPRLSPEEIKRLVAPKPKPEPLSIEAAKRLGVSAPPPPAKRRGFAPRVPQETVDAIRRDRESGMKVLEVAAKYNVSGAYVSQLHNNLVRRLPDED